MTGLNGISNFSMMPVRQDPNEYAQEYANKNGLTLEEAKEELKAKYGDPKKPQESTSNSFGSLFSMNNNEEKVGYSAEDDTDISETYSNLKNPDEFAQFYADENGMSLQEAKNELRQIAGEPKAPQINNNSLVSQNAIANLISRILDFLRNGNGPQKEGDPEYHKANEEVEAA